MVEDENVKDALGKLEDSIFGGIDDEPEDDEPEEKRPEEPSFPLLLDEKTATSIFSDVLKEKNIHKYTTIGVELIFKPYWFFTYTCDLVMKDPNGNVMDSEEIGGRIAIDAKTGQLADYLQDMLDNEPIQLSNLDTETKMLEDNGNENYKVEKPKLKEEELTHFIQQKISGALRADKENTSVGGFELVYAPVWRFWFQLKKRTHNLQIDGTGGMPINYDDIPLSPKTWRDVLVDDIKSLKDPKKWGTFIKGRVGPASTSKSASKPRGKTNTINFLLMGVGMIILIYGLGMKSSTSSILFIFIGLVMVAFGLWRLYQKPKARPIPPELMQEMQAAQMQAQMMPPQMMPPPR
jgi:hypothetical protein